MQQLDIQPASLLHERRMVGRKRLVHNKIILESTKDELIRLRRHATFFFFSEH